MLDSFLQLCEQNSITSAMNDSDIYVCSYCLQKICPAVLKESESIKKSVAIAVTWGQFILNSCIMVKFYIRDIINVPIYLSMKIITRL